MNLNAHIDYLTDFARNHLTGNQEDDRLIELKLHHTLNVLKNAEAIVKAESILGDVGRHSLLAALYHDIGRFPQFLKYKTFNDRESDNHGRIGVLAMRAAALPDDVSSKDWRFVRAAVGLHNARFINPATPSAIMTPTQVVRDADKLDIMRIFIDHFNNPDESSASVTFGLDDDQTLYSPKMYQDAIESKTGNYNDIKYVNDFKLLLIGWLQDFNFISSLKIIKKRRYVDEIFKLLPKDKNIQALKLKTNVFLINIGVDTP